MTRGKLKPINMMSFVVLAMLSVKLVLLPKDIVKYAKNDAWISILVVAVIAYLTAYAFYFISMKYPRLNFAEINTKVLGGFLGRLGIIAITAYTLISMGLSLRLFGESIKVFLLENTPIHVIMIILILASAYCVIKGIKTTSIVFDILFPGVVIVFFTIIAMTYTAADFRNLMPVLNKGFKPVIEGSFQVMDPALGCSLISYIMPYFDESKDTKKWIFIAVGIAMTMYLLIMIMCIAVFGVIEIEYLNFPTISLAKTIELRAEIFERTESFLMAAWIPNTFTRITAFYIVSTLNIKELFKVKNKKGVNKIILIQLPIIIIIALLPKNLIEVYKYIILNYKVADILNLVYLPIMLLIILIKKKGDK